MLKGRIAEAIVEDMLKEAGFQVYRFGYESVLPNLTQVDTDLNKTKSRQKILNMPDFISISKEGFVQFIEVKYRSTRPSNKDSEYRELAESWPESKILFVCKIEPHFRIANICDFVEKDFLFPLEKDEYMGVREEIIKKYAEQVITLYGCI